MGKGKKGSISIFFAMAFFVMLSLIFGMLELSRVHALRANAYQKSELAVLSAYSKYAKELAETFGVLYYWENDTLMESELLTYGKEQVTNESCILRMELSGVSIEDKTYATDEGGLNFLKQVRDIVPYRIGGEVLNDIWNLKNIEAQTSAVREFSEKMQEGQELFETVGGILSNIKDGVNQVKGFQSTIHSAYMEWDNTLKSIFEKIGQAEELTSKQWEAFEKEIDGKRSSMLQQLNKIVQQISTVRVTLKQFEEKQKEVQELTASLSEFLKGWEDTLPMTMYESLVSQLEEINENFTITESDFYGRKELITALVTLENELTLIIEKIRTIQFPSLDSILEETKEKVWDEVQSYVKEQLKEIYQDVLEECKELAVSVAGLVFKEKEYAQNGSGNLTQGMLEELTELMNHGVLALVIEDAEDVSDAVIDTSALPSTTSVTVSKEQEAFLNNEWNRVLMACYNIMYFESFLDASKEGGLQYELEYILEGQASDKDNLSKVMQEIFLMREGINFAYLLTDTVKMEEASATALAIAGAIGLPVLQIPIQILLLATWAGGEAICDLQKIYAGESVALIKTSDTWKLSLSGLGNLHKETFGEVDDGNRETGEDFLTFKYDTYLLILLLLKDGNTQTYRMMDMIQERIQEEVNAEFHMNQCVSATTGFFEYNTPTLFSGTWITNQLVSSAGEHSFKTLFSYGYTN